MDELQRYGLLSIACLVVLCLALTIKDRNYADSKKPEQPVFAKEVSDVGTERKPVALGSVVPDPEPTKEHARPDDVPERTTKDLAKDSGKTGDSGKPAKPDAGALASASPSTYEIAAGDNLRKIAKSRLGDEGRWPEIVAANPGLKANALKPGAKLKLPPKSKVASGSPLLGDVPTGPPQNVVTPESKVAAKKAVEPVDKSKKPVAADAPPAKAKPAAPRSHVVAKGETLSSIARKYYSDALQWKKIFNANKGKMKTAADVHEGLVLTVP